MQAGEAGEVISRGPDCFLGYTDPSLSAKVFDVDGWYHTGDVAVMDADGYISITDRISDVIIRGGENISAAEVEEVLMAFPGVAEVAVVAAPDPRMGEHAAAFVRMLRRIVRSRPVRGASSPRPSRSRPPEMARGARLR